MSEYIQLNHHKRIHLRERVAQRAELDSDQPFQGSHGDNVKQQNESNKRLFPRSDAQGHFHTDRL